MNNENKDNLDPKRIEKLKGYLNRLNNGEELEKVQADFVENFKDVEAMEIMLAEQELLESGTPLEEVQRLCDIHSALFHGATQNEKIANAEKEVLASVKRAAEKQGKEELDKKELALSLEAISGHPLNILHRENEELSKLIKATKEEIAQGKDITEDLKALRPVITHYAKKGDLLYPHLKVKYGVTGPSNVMWTVDDEIRDELNKLIREVDHDEAWEVRVDDVLERMDEMIYKEENILFPATALTFSEEEWKQLKHDLKDYADCFGVQVQEVKTDDGKKTEIKEEEIVLPGGSLKTDELQAIMKTLPIEVTFIDDNDINKYFNEGPKVFKRPSIALGHDVFSCHPPKVEKAVRSIIDDFKNNKRDKVQIWMEKAEKPFLVTYMAVRDDNGKYKGTMELVQDMEEIQKHYRGK